MPEANRHESESQDRAVPRLLDHFFRHQYARMVATLARVLGKEHLDMAEDAAQEALTRALHHWPFRGIPQDPAAWLYQTAKNHALDVLRRSTLLQTRLPEIERTQTAALAPADPERLVSGSERFPDDELEMIFLCCHPVLSRQDQVALTLKVVCAFSTAEIARAFLLEEPAVAQRIVRAKRRLADPVVTFRLPAPGELSRRREAVADVLYLLFNEGYTHRDSEEKLREDLTHEAIRLATVLVHHPVGNAPYVHALLALMLFQASRLSARQDKEGVAVPLAEQDRRLWDDERIESGLRHLKLAARGEDLGEYHLLAGIAACHATAESYDQTDWTRIEELYEELVRRNENPVLRLNQAVAIGMAKGPEEGLLLLEELAQEKRLRNDHLLAAARADFHRRLGKPEEARREYERAAALCPNGPERRYLERCFRADARSEAGPDNLL